MYFNRRLQTYFEEKVHKHWPRRLQYDAENNTQGLLESQKSILDSHKSTTDMDKTISTTETNGKQRKSENETETSFTGSGDPNGLVKSETHKGDAIAVYTFTIRVNTIYTGASCNITTEQKFLGLCLLYMFYFLGSIGN